MGSERIWERGAALTSCSQSFETELLTQKKNLAGLAATNSELLAKVKTIDSLQRVLVDMDSTEIPVYGQQEQSAYNRHFESPCYHPCCCSTAKETVWVRSCGRQRAQC